MNEDADYKGPKEDCVEECTLNSPHSARSDLEARSEHNRIFTDKFSLYRSLPSTTLCNGLRGTQALQGPQIVCLTQRHALVETATFGMMPVIAGR